MPPKAQKEPEVLDEQPASEQPSSEEYAYAKLLTEELLTIFVVKPIALKCWKIFKFEPNTIDTAGAKTIQELLGTIPNDSVRSDVVDTFGLAHEIVCGKLQLDPNTFKLEHSFINFDDKMFGLALHDLIGVGSFGQVKRCWDECGNLFAYKSEKTNLHNKLENIKLSGTKSDRAAKKAGQLIASGYRASKTDKPFFKDGFKVRDSSTVLKKLTVMKFVLGEDVYDFCEWISFEDDIPLFLILFHNIMKAIDVLHQKNILHLDIKLENLKIDENFHITPIDFGLSLILPSGAKFIKKSRIMGTFIPYESAHHCIYSKETDIYAAAISLFGGISYHKKGSREEDGIFGWVDAFGEPLQKIINDMSSPRSSERPDAQTICEAIRKELVDNYLDDSRVHDFFDSLEGTVIENNREDIAAESRLSIADQSLENTAENFVAPVIISSFGSSITNDTLPDEKIAVKRKNAF